MKSPVEGSRLSFKKNATWATFKLQVMSFHFVGFLDVPRLAIWITWMGAIASTKALAMSVQNLYGSSLLLSMDDGNATGCVLVCPNMGTPTS